MYMYYARNTYGGQIPENSGKNPNATIVFSPSIEQPVGQVDTKDYEGKAE